MTGIILELQKEALDSKGRISDLLRKALLVARKLKQPEIEAWILSELNGYPDKADFPPYRQMVGEVKSFNPYNGIWMPVMFPESLSKFHRSLTHRPCNQAISEIEALLDGGNDLMAMRYSPEIQAKLIDNAGLPSPPMLHVSAAHLHGILDAVRTEILEWALKLESQGVVGKNLSFSEEERKAASGVTINIGTMTHSQIQADTVASTQTMLNDEINLEALQVFIKALEGQSKKLGLDKEQADELVGEVATIKAQAASPKPKQGILKESLHSVRNILEGAAGSVTAEGLLRSLENLL